MKKKKEFFRIRKDRKRKNGANARACVYVYTKTEPAAFQIREKNPTNDREKPLTVFEPKDKPTDREPLFCFLNITDRVLFSKQRWKARVLFSKLASKWESPSRSPYACACVCICTQTHPPPTSENSQERRSYPFQALQGTYKPFYGRDR